MFEKHGRDFSGTRGSGSRIALRHTPLFHPGGDTLDVLCYRDGRAGPEPKRKKGGIYFEQRRPSL